MTGSGTAAVESMVAALVPAEGRLLIVENGVYGERIAQICAQYGIAHERVSGDWMQAPDLDAIAARLDRADGCAASRTWPSCIMKRPPAGSMICGALGAAVPRARSAAAGRWRQQLRRRGDRFQRSESGGGRRHGQQVPARRAGRRIRDRAAHAPWRNAASRTYYLDLARLARLQEQRNTPFTPAVHAYYALVEALREFAEQGGRAARYGAMRRWLSRCARACGTGHRPRDSAGRVLGGVACLSLAGGHRRTRHCTMRLKADGFVIYAGQGDLSKTLFRISTMGNIGRSRHGSAAGQFRAVARMKACGASCAAGRTALAAAAWARPRRRIGPAKAPAPGPMPPAAGRAQQGAVEVVQSGDRAVHSGARNRRRSRQRHDAGAHPDLGARPMRITKSTASSRRTSFTTRTSAYGVHGRMYGYTSADEQWSVVAGIKQRVEREFDAEYQRGRLRDRRWSFTASLIYDRNGTPRFYGIGNKSPSYRRKRITPTSRNGRRSRSA